jgi:hypothetical protein
VPVLLIRSMSEAGMVGGLSDTFGASRRFRILAVNDDCCRENLCLMADTSISGARGARELGALVRLYGKPASIVGDRGRVAMLINSFARAFVLASASMPSHQLFICPTQDR